jgi:intracellular multiplication protein IcmK
MKKYLCFSLALLISGLISSIGLTYAAEGDNQSAAVTNTAPGTKDTAGNDPQTDQMIKEIQQLKDNQQRQAERQFGTAPEFSANTSASSRAGQTTMHVSAPYHSDFQYPHAKAQLRKTPIGESISQAAFSGAVHQALPLTPEQIHRLKQIYDAAQFAAAAPAGTPPRPVATSVYANLSPGSTPPAIRLSEGFVSSLVFLDSTGAPWPVAAYDLGNPNAFNVAWDKQDNVLMIQAKTLYTYGNLAVRLRGLNTPVMLTLIPGQAVVDYRTDITIPGYGPDAKSLAIDTTLPPQAASVLLDILDGVPPTGSKQLVMSDSFGAAWSLRGKMYVRTHYTLLSPGWLATMSSADGTHAYEVQPTPMLLMSKNGKIVHVKIGGL